MNSLSNADFGSLSLRIEDVCRSTRTLGENQAQSLAVSFGEMAAGTGCRHWNRAPGSKLAHCTQLCSAARHFGHVESAAIGDDTSVAHARQRTTSWLAMRRGVRGASGGMLRARGAPASRGARGGAVSGRSRAAR